MDFGTLRKKLDAGGYSNLEELEVGLDLSVLVNSISNSSSYRYSIQTSVLDSSWILFQKLSNGCLENENLCICSLSLHVRECFTSPGSND